MFLLQMINSKQQATEASCTTQCIVQHHISNKIRPHSLQSSNIQKLLKVTK